MNNPKIIKHQSSNINHENDKVAFGFWVYLMTDLLMFSVLFAAYIVLHNNTNGAESAHLLFDPNYALIETIILLTSSFTCGLAMLFAKAQHKSKTLIFFGLTFLLGASFLVMELTEFSKMFAEGNTPQRSAFLSAFFTLVGTHGLHIFSGLMWMGIMLEYIFKHGINDSAVRKLTLLTLFWHFLDIVWIFIFTIVYLLGVLY